MENKNSVAANRAAQQLQAQYGMRAAGSINAIQDRMGQQPQMQGQQPGQVPGAPVLPQQPQQIPQPHEQPHLGNAQVDGAGDEMMEDSSDDEESFEGVMLRHGVNGNPEELGRVDIDRILHDQIAAKAKSMEGGGLMVSLREATKAQSKSKAGKKSRSKAKARDGVAAYDGGDDDEDEIDEDAINSDLDDPDEDRDDDEVDDEGLGHIMLCMYDKVQRVKNKW